MESFSDALKQRDLEKIRAIVIEELSAAVITIKV